MSAASEDAVRERGAEGIGDGGLRHPRTTASTWSLTRRRRPPPATGAGWDRLIGKARHGHIVQAVAADDRGSAGRGEPRRRMGCHRSARRSVRRRRRPGDAQPPEESGDLDRVQWSELQSLDPASRSSSAMSREHGSVGSRSSCGPSPAATQLPAGGSKGSQRGLASHRPPIADPRRPPRPAPRGRGAGDVQDRLGGQPCPARSSSVASGVEAVTRRRFRQHAFDLGAGRSEQCRDTARIDRADQPRRPSTNGAWARTRCRSAACTGEADVLAPALSATTATSRLFPMPPRRRRRSGRPEEWRRSRRAQHRAATSLLPDDPAPFDPSAARRFYRRASRGRRGQVTWGTRLARTLARKRESIVRVAPSVRPIDRAISWPPYPIDAMRSTSRWTGVSSARAVAIWR